MLLVCPSCHAKYAVKAKSVGSEGRKVRCAKCKHKWHIEPPSEEELAMEETGGTSGPIPKGSNVPVIVGPPAPIWAKAACGFMVFIFIFTYSFFHGSGIVRSSSFTSGYYGIFGIYDTSLFTFYDPEIKGIGSDNSAQTAQEDENEEVAAKSSIDLEKTPNISITGTLMNESSDPRVIPKLRITVYDEEEKQIHLAYIESSGENIYSGESYKFEKTLEDLPKNSHKIVLDIGNNLDFMLR
ncbi:zinc-ribbon domain-containing protein [Rickettsiales bacterium]|nr:zinc-ribbon domain-containing protein [Rickettsiales bacterium]